MSSAPCDCQIQSQFQDIGRIWDDSAQLLLEFGRVRTALPLFRPFGRNLVRVRPNLAWARPNLGIAPSGVGAISDPSWPGSANIGPTSGQRSPGFEQHLNISAEVGANSANIGPESTRFRAIGCMLPERCHRFRRSRGRSRHRRIPAWVDRLPCWGAPKQGVEVREDWRREPCRMDLTVSPGHGSARKLPITGGHLTACPIAQFGGGSPGIRCIRGERRKCANLGQWCVYSMLTEERMSAAAWPSPHRAPMLLALVGMLTFLAKCPQGHRGGVRVCARVRLCCVGGRCSDLCVDPSCVWCMCNHDIVCYSH